MNFLKVASLSIAAVLLTGCQTPPARTFAPPQDYVPMAQVKIEPRFAVTALTKDNLDIEARRCVTTLPMPATSVENVKNRWPIPTTESVTLGHASSASSFIISRGQGFCVRSSDNKFAILAGEALQATTNPDGVPPDTLSQWYQLIAKQLATTGIANVVYVMSNGNAFAVKYWLSEQSPKHGLLYTSEFKRTGSWENNSYDLRFQDKDIKGVGVTERNGRKQKFDLLNHRF